jgi:hypothetical protein
MKSLWWQLNLLSSDGPGACKSFAASAMQDFAFRFARSFVCTYDPTLICSQAASFLACLQRTNPRNEE